MMLSSAWTGGGTDYGGCAGRHAAFSLKTGYNQCDATTQYDPGFHPTPLRKGLTETPDMRWGIFGRVNESTTFGEIRDGLANTILTGELQRITDLTPTSKDGWVIGGPATLFTTGAMFRRWVMFRPEVATCRPVASPSDGTLMNNGFFGSPGSDHPGGATSGWLTARCSSSPKRQTRTFSPGSAAWRTTVSSNRPKGSASEGQSEEKAGRVARS